MGLISLVGSLRALRHSARLARSLGGPIAIYKRAVLIVALVSLPALGHGEPTKASAAETVSPKTAITFESDASKLESEKFEYQKALEEKKLGVEQLKAWLTGGSILIPLVLGILTLAWQSRTTTKLKEREALDAFELKAAEIVLNNVNTPIAVKRKAKVLAELFPNKLPSNFAEAMDPSKYGGVAGTSVENKLELFRAACSKVQSPAEVYEIWHQIFPGHNWIKPLLPNLSLNPDAANSAPPAI